MTLKTEEKFLGITRIVLGFIFFWAFIDKLFGLGFATTPDKAWLAGGSPTLGFLAHGTYGPFAAIYQSLAGTGWVDFLFMLGLLCIGAALILGMGVRIAGFTGALLVLFMYTAAWPPANNPLVDDHIVYAFLLLAFAHMKKVGTYYGLGKWWASQDIVKQNPILQ